MVWPLRQEKQKTMFFDILEIIINLLSVLFPDNTMTASGPDFVQPPWVYGPKETMDWIEATHPSKKEGKKTHKDRGKELLKNMHIRLDLDVRQTTIIPSNVFSKFLSKITKNEKIEEHFEIIHITDIILRALAKAKFRNTRKIVVDGKTLYNHPEITTDLRKTIDILEKSSLNNTRYIEISATLTDVEKCTAEIKIKKIHRRKEHSIDILMKGEIKRELYHVFCNYLVEKLGLEKESLAE